MRAALFALCLFGCGGVDAVDQQDQELALDGTTATIRTSKGHEKVHFNPAAAWNARQVPAKPKSVSLVVPENNPYTQAVELPGDVRNQVIDERDLRDRAINPAADPRLTATPVVVTPLNTPQEIIPKDVLVTEPVQNDPHTQAVDLPEDPRLDRVW